MTGRIPLRGGRVDSKRAARVTAAFSRARMGGLPGWRFERGHRGFFRTLIEGRVEQIRVAPHPGFRGSALVILVLLALGTACTEPSSPADSAARAGERVRPEAADDRLPPALPEADPQEARPAPTEDRATPSRTDRGQAPAPKTGEAEGPATGLAPGDGSEAPEAPEAPEVAPATPPCVKGRVVNAFGEPVGRAEIVLVRAVRPGLENLAPVHASGRGDAGGRFCVALPAAGPGFVLAVRAPECVPVVRDNLYVYHGRPTDLDELELDLGFTVSGRVVDEQGAPVAGARIQVLGSAANRPAWAALGKAGVNLWSDAFSNVAAGVFRLGPFGHGAWDLRCVASGCYPRTIQDRRLHPDEREVRLVLSRGAALEGLVRDADDQPVPSAVVTILSPAVHHEPVRCEVDASGRFECRGLPDRKPCVRVEAPGYVGVQVSDVDPGTGPLRVALTRVAGVRGRIRTGPDGSELPDRFQAVAYRLDGQAAHAPRIKWCEGVMDGVFDWDDLEPGRWQFEVRARGFAFARSTEVSLAAGESRSLLPLTLESPWRIAGLVVDGASGRPVPGARLAAEDALGCELAVVRSDARGLFTLTGLQRGSYRVSVTSGEYAPSVCDAVRTGDSDVLLCRMARAGELHGTVFRGADRPWPGARVAIRPESAEGRAAEIRYAVADDHGRFRLHGLETGPCQVWVLPDEAAPEDGSTGPVAQVDIRAGWSTRMDLNSRMQSELLGTVRRLELPVAGVHVVLTELDAPGGADRGAWHVWSDARGAFRVAGLPPRQLRLRAYSPGGLEIGEKRLAVVPVSTVRADVSLSGGRVVGTVETDITCRPVPGVSIQLVPAAESSPVWIEERHHQGVTTDAQGRFEITHAPAGRYRLRTVKAGFVPVVTGPFDLDADDLHGPVRIRLNGGATLRGRIVDGQSGKAGLESFFRLLDAAGKACTDVAPLHVARRGAFCVHGIRPGPYRIEFFRPGFRPRVVSVTLEPGMNRPVRVTLHAKP